MPMSACDLLRMYEAAPAAPTARLSNGPDRGACVGVSPLLGGLTPVFSPPVTYAGACQPPSRRRAPALLAGQSAVCRAAARHRRGFLCKAHVCRHCTTRGTMNQLVIHVTGARPNFPKAAPVLEALTGREGIEQLLCTRDSTMTTKCLTYSSGSWVSPGRTSTSGSGPARTVVKRQRSWLRSRSFSSSVTRRWSLFTAMSTRLLPRLWWPLRWVFA